MPSCSAMVSCALLLGAALLLAASRSVNASPLSSQSYLPAMDPEPDSEYMLEMLARMARLGQSLITPNDVENSKRALDLGLSRGFSGSQAAKHLMGLAAANYAGGPGRRRRSAVAPFAALAAAADTANVAKGVGVAAGSHAAAAPDEDSA